MKPLTVTRQVQPAGRVAIRWLGRNGDQQDITCDDLRRHTRVPLLYVTALGTLENARVYTPLFSAFGPDPIVARLTKARARVLVTTEALFQRKVLPVRAQLPELEHVLLLREGSGPAPRGTRDFLALLATADDRFEIPATDPQDLALKHFTSGTTGTPKGAASTGAAAALIAAGERLDAVQAVIAIVPGATHLHEEPGALEFVSQLALDWCRCHLQPRRVPVQDTP